MSVTVGLGPRYVPAPNLRRGRLPNSRFIHQLSDSRLNGQSVSVEVIHDHSRIIDNRIHSSLLHGRSGEAGRVSVDSRGS
jgi:hypothetical protein